MPAFLFSTNALFRYHFISCIYHGDRVLGVECLGAEYASPSLEPSALNGSISMGASGGNRHLVLTAAPCKMWAWYQDPYLHPRVASGDHICSKSTFIYIHIYISIFTQVCTHTHVHIYINKHIYIYKFI